MKTYTTTADASGNWNITFDQKFESAQKVTVTAEKDSISKQISLNAPSSTLGGGVIQFSGSMMDFPKNIGEVTINLESIGKNAFASSEYAKNFLTNATKLILNNIKTIDETAFNYLSGVSAIQFADTLTKIGPSAFYYCSSVRSIQFSQNLVTLSNSCFAYCSALQKIELFDKTEEIGSYAFRFCQACTEIKIGSDIKKIGSGAFARNSCKKFTITAITPPTISSDALDLGTSCIIYVPASALDTYKTATNWSKYASQMVAV